MVFSFKTTVFLQNIYFFKKISNIIKNKIIADNEAYIACLFDAVFHPTKLIIPIGRMRYKK